MDITVQTGHTKAHRGTSLVSETMASASGEDVCILLQIEADPGDAKTMEKECLTIVKHSLLETEGDAAARLDGTLKEINGLFKGLALSQSIGELHAIVSIIDKSGVLHVSHAGRAEAYVIRGGTASQITEYTKGKPTPGFIHIASGPLEPRDTVIFSSQRLLRTVTPAQLAQLAQRTDHLMDEIIMEMEAEKEQATLAIVHASGGRQPTAMASAAPMSRGTDRRKRARASSGMAGKALSLLQTGVSSTTKGLKAVPVGGIAASLKPRFQTFLKDLKDPKRKRRAHLLLLAGTVAAFLIIWAVVNLSTSSQKRQTRAELEERLEQIEQQIRTAENRRLSGEVDSANAILEQAEERTKQVMDNESNLFRTESLDLLERIRAKREEINNIVRLAPRLVVNLASKNPDVDAQGLIGTADGEFVAYDRQSLYRVLLNSVDDPDSITDEELILDGTDFPRFQTSVYQTTDNSIIEFINDQPTSMKTEDPAGWIKGQDLKTYLRFLYVLSPTNNQIYKYERLSNRYGPPTEYNVNADLANALDMVIDGSIYVLKTKGELLKVLRGEVQPFTIRHLPEGALADATKLYKVADGNIYILDPVNSRVIVVTDGGPSGESSYVKQYVLEGDQIGTLRDLYVDPDESHLYLIDEKRIHAIDL